jgi:hypothetical protein
VIALVFLVAVVSLCIEVHFDEILSRAHQYKLCVFVKLGSVEDPVIQADGMLNF